jgi:hypothetical protein
MSNNQRTRLIKPTRTQDDLGKWEVLNTSGSKVNKDSIIRVTGTTSSGAYHTFAPAISDGSQKQTQLLVLWPDSFADALSIASERRLLTMDTSTAAVGDLVYLSASVAGAITLTPTAEPIGRVHTVGAEGYVWIDPKWALATATQAGLENVRPDWDTDWEATILGGDGDVYVDNVSGDDDTADGTQAKPYATLQAAILDIPHNRNDPSLLTVTVNLVNTGTAYTIPVHLEAWTRITIVGTLPTEEVSGAVGTIVTSTTQEGLYFDTDITHGASDDEFRGYLIKFGNSGRYGWVNYSTQVGSTARLYCTQSVNGAAYSLTGGETVYLYNPSDMVALNSLNTGGAGTSHDQYDLLKVKSCNVGALGTSAKLVFYQARHTYEDCYIGAAIKRLSVNNGSLNIDNCYIYVDGEGEKFGMLGAVNYGNLNIQGGTCIDGGNAGSSNNTPLTARGFSRITLSGPAFVRACRGLSLSEGSAIEYTNGYNAEVSWYWWEHQAAEPIVEIDYYDTGAVVHGVIPDIHGDALNAGTVLVNAKAPCRIYLGRGTDIIVTGKLAGIYDFSVSNGTLYNSGDGYDESFIRWDRDRSGAVLGTNLGPYSKLGVAGVNLNIDFSRGRHQKVDASASAAGNIAWTFNNGHAGEWHTVEIVNGLNVVHTIQGTVWAGGTPPTITATANARDLLRFYYNGTDWIGEVVAQDVS